MKYYLMEQKETNKPIHPALVDERQKKPHCCPICNGRGRVPAKFYYDEQPWSTSDSAYYQICRSCVGTGIVWS